MNTLDNWENKIKDSIEYRGDELCSDQKEFFRQNLALIDLVRKKDELIKYCLGPTRDVKTRRLQEALALTDFLK